MGVLRCSRNGCSNIMCDTYVPGIGYVCMDCQGQFKKYLINQGMQPDSELQVESALKLFLDTDSDTYQDDPDAVDIEEFFRQYTKRY